MSAPPNFSVPSKPGKRKRTPSPPRSPNAKELLLQTDRTRYGLFWPGGYSSPTSTASLNRPKTDSGPAGYNHSALRNTFVMKVKMPAWLTDLPPLPICSNPESLLAFCHCRNTDIPMNRYSEFANAYTPAFSALAYHGDKHLTTLSWNIISQLFGFNNRRLIENIFSDWVSNKNWMLLAVSYRLDRYAGWAPRTYINLLLNGDDLSSTLRTYKDNKPKGDMKYWADLWEAWWACIMFERQLWNEDTRDIEVILQTLILKKYQKLMEFSMCISTMEAERSETEGLKINKNDVEITKITRSHPILEECLGPSDEIKKDFLLGYLAKLTIPDTKRCLTSYALTENDALKNITELAESSHSPCPVLIPSVILPEKDSSTLRQKIFDTVVKNCFGILIPLEHATIKLVFRQIQTLGNTLITSSVESAFKTHTKLFAILFFSEAILAFQAEEFGAAMNSVLCVILFCVVRKGSHKILLQECLSLYHRIRGEVRTRGEVKDGYFLRESTPSNFLLSIGKNRFESGKLVINDYELTWGEPSDSLIRVSLHLDLRGPTSFPENYRKEDLRSYSPFQFMTSSWYHEKTKRKERQDEWGITTRHTEEVSQL